MMQNRQCPYRVRIGLRKSPNGGCPKHRENNHKSWVPPVPSSWAPGIPRTPTSYFQKQQRTHTQRLFPGAGQGEADWPHRRWLDAKSLQIIRDLWRTIKSVSEFLSGAFRCT